jgi:hypothetical protein
MSLPIELHMQIGQYLDLRDTCHLTATNWHFCRVFQNRLYEEPPTQDQIRSVIKKGNVAAFRRFLQHGMDPNINLGWNPEDPWPPFEQIMSYAQEGRKQMLQLLVDHPRIDPEVVLKYNTETYILDEGTTVTVRRVGEDDGYVSDTNAGAKWLVEETTR